MSWSRALAVWLLIVMAESVHGFIRQRFIAPLVGEVSANQIGVLIGSIIIFIIAWLYIHWIGAISFRQQLGVGVLWVILILIFEFSLGIALGYSQERMLSGYNLAKGGLMPLGLAFMLFAPNLAARVRRFGQYAVFGARRQE
jgi:hypothetical protein